MILAAAEATKNLRNVAVKIRRWKKNLLQNFSP
jgi:hypothetical protein